MSRDLSRRIPAILVLLAMGAVSALLLWSRRDYVPIFDGRIYADCIARVATDLGDFPGYRCAGHIAESYVAITALAMRLAPGTPGALLVANALLLLAGAVALGRLMRSAFPDETHRLGRAMVVGAFLVHPVVLAAVVQPGLDLGLLVFSLCALAAAVEGRRWGLVLFGILLIFSKEPGVLLYGAIAAVWMWRRYAGFMSPDDASRIGIAALVFLGFLSLIDAEVPSALFLLSAAAIVAHRPLRPALPPKKGLVRVVLQDWPLAIPVLILVAYLAAYAMRSASGPDGAPGKPLVWGGGGGALALVDALLRGGVFDPPTRSSLALMFVVGFLWVPSLWTLADLVVGAIRHVRNAPPRPLPGVDRSALGFIVVVLIADVWLLSRFVTYSNARYYLPVFPLGLLAAYGALVRLRVPALPRAGLLASAAVLLAVSTVRTVDPVSRAIWGTFEVGDRSLLSVTSLRKECCGHGRDQLAYNLEFTQFATLQDLLYERLKPQDGVLVVPEYGDWFVVERLDSATHRRTMRSDGSYVPTVLEAQKAQDLDAPTAWYVEMPYIKDTTFRAMLTKSYEFTEPCRVSHDGYALTAYTMRLRPKTLVSQSGAVRDRRCLPGAPSRPTPVLSIR